MNELHNKIYSHLMEHDAEELNNYMLEYSIFITRHGVTTADERDRGTTVVRAARRGESLGAGATLSERVCL